jgi:phosphoribosylaminoimidazolecarboxamide formyltransferase/IMP cyclohydrolase
MKAFNEISLYDMDISNWFLQKRNEKNKNFLIQSEIVKKLRYGENPKQKAAIYKNTSLLNNKNSFFNMKIIQGKELSYNNINDMQAGCLLADDINEPCVVIIKHANPCGVSKSNNLLEAYKKAFMCDPVSAFGGIIIINGNIDKKLAEEISKTFVEIVVGKKISKEAKNIFQNKKNLILIETKSFKIFKPSKEIKSMSDAFLIQTPDNFHSKKNNLKFVTKKKLKLKEINDLLLAEKICKYVKSNAIVYVKNNSSIGIGAGQMNRLDSAKIGAEKAKRFFNKSILKGSFVASDAFFPFPDSIDVFGKFGVKAIIQPGGSVKDIEVIKRANKYKIAMAFTNMRHFKH